MIDLFKKLGFVEELSEYILDAGQYKKYKKIKSWIPKAISRAQTLAAKDKDLNDEAEQLLNDDDV